MPSATFRFAVRRASGAGRHGNAFFVFGPSGEPEQLIECRLYYGGRSSLMITGTLVEQAEKKVDFRGKEAYEVSVRVNCDTGTVTLDAVGQTVTAKFRSDCAAITHYGYGGANSDNLFTGILVE
jgi:hypothetical protein